VSADSGAPTWLHASALIVREAGILICGPSGAGKSGLALALLELARERGLFAALVGDDRVEVRAAGGRVLVRGAANVQGLIEQRGYGIVEAQAEPCAVVRLVVDLLAERRAARMPEREELVANLAGIDLPRLMFGAESATIERAYATLGWLDKIDDKIMTRLAHFA
jgi:serine kinase of HPr protein (carbohydrate metabolism regulator)